MTALFAILFLIFFVLCFGALLLGVASILGPKKSKSAIKSSSYECGLPSFAQTNNVPVKYYLTAILFIIFDIEIVFIYPWAVAYKDFLTAGWGLYILIAMLIFIALFLYGLIWEIRSKALDWH
ncbi:MAG: NADH-quinone oxidoreductase subunit A [Bdellovibrionaceae bacterium]|nr:NADH-quinone oxidoreductase subunit A [Pseudobdellovibrionaceae bacterium]